MPIEAAFVKPIVDAFLWVIKRAKTRRLKASAESALTQVIRDLLTLSPNITNAEARIAAARATGLITEDLLHAERLLSAQREFSRKKAAKKKAAKKKPMKKKAMKKRAMRKMARRG